MNIKQTLRSNVFILSIIFVLAVVLGYTTLSYASSRGSLLKLNSKAPDFTLIGTHGKKVSLKDFKGKNLIIVFYPMDNTPGCTAQLCALRDEFSRLQLLKTEIIASNPGTLDSHEKFSKKHSYPFPLLVDDNQLMAKAYLSAGPFGINHRTVYIVNEEGVIRFAKRGAPNIDELVDTLLDLNFQTTGY